MTQSTLTAPVQTQLPTRPVATFKGTAVLATPAATPVAAAPAPIAAPAAPSTVGTSTNPTERMMYQLTDLVDNHNKFWLVELWPATNGSVNMRATWGRVGSKPQVKEKVATRREVEKQIEEKVRKGYRPVQLHTPQVIVTTATDATGSQPAVQIDPKVLQLVEWIFAEAGEHIQSYLAVPVDALSDAQVEEGRRLLAQAQVQHLAYKLNPFNRTQSLDALISTVEAYYNSIPTILPARIDRDEVVKRFCDGLSEQENRLNQLEAAIKTLKEQRQHPGVSLHQILGANIKVLDDADSAKVAICDYIKRTQVHGYNINVRDVFEIEVPEERKAYEANKRGISRKELLFHGTHNRNVRHILRSGLICPKTPSHGRMLGNGIYLANKATKSSNYCSASRRGLPQMMFVVEAAVGKLYEAPDARQHNAPPKGYDAVLGKAGFTKAGAYTLAHDEFVVYSQAQQTLRYLVTFDR